MKELPPVQAELLAVELTSETMPSRDAMPTPSVDPDQPPPLPNPLEPPQAVPMVAVAEPSTAVAFAVPYEGPSQIVPVAQAVPQVSAATTPASPSASSSAAAIQTITFGQGEGRQPAPDYPRQAAREGQEGTVLVRFSVGENGRVLGAEAVDPCPWTLLNEAALRAIRERWRFRAGAVRVFEVPIRFALTQ